MTVSRKVNASEFWSRMLMLCVLLEGIVNKLLITVLPIDNLIGYVMLTIAVFVVLTNNLYLNRMFMLLYACCWVLLICSAVFIGGSAVKEYIFQFLSFGSCGVLCAMTQVDIEKLFKIGSIASVIFLVVTFIQKFADAWFSPFSFGHTLIPGWIITFYNVYNEKQKHRYWRMCLWFCAFVLETVCLIRFCSRGNLIQMYIFVVICIMLLFRKKILGLFCIATGLLGLIFIEPIIMVLYKAMFELGVRVDAIRKSYRLLTDPSENLMHGRIELLAEVFEKKDAWNIIFGRGVGAYENITETYTHNIFSQAFSELGLIGVILIGTVFFLFIKVMIDQRNNLYETEFYIMLFVVVLVKLFFSSVYWRISAFWLLVGIIYIKRCRKNTNVIIKI